MSAAATAASCLFVIFGATGDLMRRKLLPALFHLSESGQLPANLHVLGVARGSLNDTQFQLWARSSLAEAGFTASRVRHRWCNHCLHYHRLDQQTPAAFDALRKRIDDLEREHALSGNRVFYLALPPQAFAGIIEGLGRADLNREPGWTRRP